nr:hypothetical protein [Tanacetum cinerariifolium]
MKEKFDKYWNESNMLMCIGSILDPRCKFTMLELYFKDIYDENEIQKRNLELKKILREIHAEYARLLRVRPASSTSDSSSYSHEGETEQVGPSRGFSYYNSRLKQTDVFDLESSDLDVYLEEGIYLSHFLAIPITTVASEATFSAGGHVIDTYRASLDLDSVQALICGGDWIRKHHGVKKKNKKEKKPQEIVLVDVSDI